MIGSDKTFSPSKSLFNLAQDQVEEKAISLMRHRKLQHKERLKRARDSKS